MRRDYAGAGSNTSLRAMMASETHTWETPPGLFRALDEEFNFTLDPCCVPETAKCSRYFTPTDDGLSRSWAGERVFMNPPYGRALPVWMRKAKSESEHGALVVCLVPARTDTAWWHDHVLGFAEVRFIRGRVAFLLDGRKGDPAFGSAIVIYRPRVKIDDMILQLELDRDMVDRNRLPATERYRATLAAIAALRSLRHLQELESSAGGPPAGTP